MSGQQHAPAALYPRERYGTHCTGGWVGPRASLDGRKISSPPGFDPGPSSPQSVAIPTELPGPLTSGHTFDIPPTNCLLMYSYHTLGSTVLMYQKIFLCGYVFLNVDVHHLLFTYSENCKKKKLFLQETLELRRL